MRTITLENEELLEILKQRGEIVAEAGKLTDEINRLDKERNKQGIRMQKLKEKVTKIIAKEKISLGEFEEIEKIEIKDGKVNANIADRLDDFREAYKKRNAGQ